MLLFNRNKIENIRGRNKRVKNHEFWHDQNERPYGGVAFAVKKDLKVSFDPIPSRCATLQLKLGNKHLEFLGCSAPIQSNADGQVKKYSTDN